MTSSAKTKRDTLPYDENNKRARIEDSGDEIQSSSGSTCSTNGEKSSLAAIPVTILSGFLGSGKTTLLKHILTSTEHKLRIAVIVNDMAELNIDGQTIQRTGDVVNTKKEVVTLQNGCICCTLRGDLIREINRIRESKQFDYVLIESTGIAEPQQVAESFCVDPETQQLAGNDESMLWNSARLDTCVTVVDAVHFPKYLSSLKRFQQVFQDGLDDADTGEGEKSISQLMVEQVEFANIILLNKVDLASDEDLHTSKKLIQSLNPEAKVITCSHGKIDLQLILNTHLFSMEEARLSPGWLLSLKNGVDASEGEADEYGVSSFVYRARKPFHPKRMHSFLTQFFMFADDWHMGPSQQEWKKNVDTKVNKKYGTILRSKGTCWIAGRDDHEMGWAQTGRIIQISPESPWYCKQDLDELGDEQSEKGRAWVKSLFHDPDDENVKYEYGDRRQEIVLIGTNLQKAAIEDGLNQCLLTEEEMKQHTTDLPIGAYPDPLHPLLVDCQGSSSLFMIARPGQNQHIHIYPGYKLSLFNIALNISDEDSRDKIGSVKVWLDKTDSVKCGVLIATLRPDSHEYHSLNMELMPCDTTGGEEETHRRFRLEVLPRRGCSFAGDEMEICEVHCIGAVEPIPYAEGEEADEDEDEANCHDGTCD